jgi:ribonuclease P protein component
MSGPTPWAAARRRQRHGSAAIPSQTNQHFPPDARLHHKREYSRLFYRQQKAAGRNIVILLGPRHHRRDGTASRGRLGIQVSVKVHKRAVRRHQLKRWVREWFRTTQQQPNGLASYDCVVLFRSDPCDHRSLVQQLDRLTPKAKQAEPQPRQRAGHKRRKSSATKK